VDIKAASDQIDALIERQAQQRAKANLEAGREQANRRQREELVRQENRRLWAAHHLNQAGSHARLAKTHLERAAALEREQ